MPTTSPLSRAERRTLTAIDARTLGRVAQSTLESLVSRGLIRRASASSRYPWELTEQGFRVVDTATAPER